MPHRRTRGLLQDGFLREDKTVHGRWSIAYKSMRRVQHGSRGCRSNITHLHICSSFNSKPSLRSEALQTHRSAFSVHPSQMILSRPTSSPLGLTVSVSEALRASVHCSGEGPRAVLCGRQRVPRSTRVGDYLHQIMRNYSILSTQLH